MPSTIAQRPGERPHTFPRTPHQQLDQIAPIALQETLWARMIGLPDVSPGPSGISLPDTRALHLDPRVAHGPQTAFVPTGGTEFAHLHGPGDGSLHLTLPEETAAEAIRQGWAELHPIVGLGYPPVIVMIYGPRDEAECDTIWHFITLSYDFARGTFHLA
ncbi:luciferase family protein [Kribbella sp. NPDC050124]|uniref:luciferase domain-containing protein n=1 Tax=Kribbella sp. NPDC050124 TaxID=3364114 RepID=UPI0037B5F8A4